MSPLWEVSQTQYKEEIEYVLVKGVFNPLNYHPPLLTLRSTETEMKANSKCGSDAPTDDLDSGHEAQTQIILF